MSNTPDLPKNPLLYQINARLLISELSATCGRAATLFDLSDTYLDTISSRGFNIVYLLGVWQTGEAGIAMSRKKLAGKCPEEWISSSPFAITAYDVDVSLGGAEALCHFRQRLHSRGVLLLVDFVPNHLAVDHPWTRDPGKAALLMPGTEAQLAAEPQNFFRSSTGAIFAHGRDPYFDGWTDTVQLNYFNEELRDEMRKTLNNIAGIADGVRCDMAMLVISEVFERTWRQRYNTTEGSVTAAGEFWEATREIKAEHPGFLFMAEVYWDMEWRLQQQGFDYTYDKRLYDRLEHADAPGIYAHLCGDRDFLTKCVHFIENHDEPRAVTTFPGKEQHRAAALIAYTVPGLRFFHEGQLQGRSEFVSMHVRKRTPEVANPGICKLYTTLLDFVIRSEVSQGISEMIHPQPSRDGNGSYKNIISHIIHHSQGYRVWHWLIVVNYSDATADGHLPLHMLQGKKLASAENWAAVQNAEELLLIDYMSNEAYVRPAGEVIHGEGLWVSLKPWAAHAFKVLHP